MHNKEEIKEQILETPAEDLLEFLDDLVNEGVIEFVGEYPIN